MLKMTKTWKTTLCQNFILIKMCFGLLTGYLLVEELLVFFIYKPTYVSSSIQKMGKISFENEKHCS